MQRELRDSLILAAIGGVLLISAVAWREVGGLEFRTALFVRHILEEGPSLIPRLYDSPYFDYPPLYFLFAAVTSSATGSLNPLSLALPGIIAGAATVLICCLFAGGVSRRVGWMSGTALLATPVFLFYGSQAAVDMMLTFFISLCLVSYHLYLSSRKTYLLLLACAGLAGGALTKGPVGIVLPLAVIILYLAAVRRFREIVRVGLWLGLFILIFASLIGGAVAISEGPAALRELANTQVLDRIADEPNEPRAYYIGVFFAGFAPWSLCAFFQLFRRAGTVDKEKILLFSKVWILVTFLIFTMARIKHTRYLLPLALPTAILCAAFWEEYLCTNTSRHLRAFLSFIRIICVTALAVGTAAVLIVPIWLPAASMTLTWLLPPLGIVALVLATRWFRQTARDLLCLLAIVICFGFLVYCQLCLPYESAKRESRPFVVSVEREAQGLPVVFFLINRDKQGLRYAYWSARENDLIFTDTIEELEGILLHETSVLVISPVDWRETLQKALGEKLEFLFEGRIGKRKYAVFRWNC